MNRAVRNLLTVFSAVAFFSIAKAQIVISSDDGFYVIPLAQQQATTVYYDDFAAEADGDRIDQFVAYRDPFVVNHTTGLSDHTPTGGINCSLPD